MNRFSADTPHSEVNAAIKADGYAIIENVLTRDERYTLMEEINPYLMAARPDGGNSFMGEKTIRFGRLMFRVPATRDLVRRPAIISALDATLRPYSPTYQLHFSGVMHVTRGEKAQVLHRDISPFPNPGPTVVLATMWALSDFTRDNGATVFVPGSHHWPDRRSPLKSELEVAEMPAGSVLLYAGNLIHGAGACKSIRPRTGVSLQYCVGWMRQEENQYLAVPLHVAQGFDHDLQRLIGYDLAGRHWGYVDQMHPMSFLNGGDFGGLDPVGYEFPGRVTALQATENGLHLDHRYPVTLDD